MAVLKKHRRPGMSPDAYDQIASGVMDSQKKADGFIAHYAILENDGITVIEIWESVGHHDAWFNPTVKPLLPADTPEPEFSEIHNSNTK